MSMAKKNIPQDFLEQVKTNLTISETTSVSVESNNHMETDTVSKITQTIQTTQNSKKGKYADAINVRLSNGRRDEIKRFYTNCGVTATQYIESSFEFLAKEIAVCHIVISIGEISKVN